MPVRSLTRLAALAAAVMLTGCSTNNFERNYHGEFHPENKHARVVLEQPEGTRLIGTSTFVSGGAENGRDALKAAKEVGADYVEWTKAYSHSTETEHVREIRRPVLILSRDSGEHSRNRTVHRDGTITRDTGHVEGGETVVIEEVEYEPYTVVHDWIEYHAWFYKAVR